MKGMNLFEGESMDFKIEFYTTNSGRIPVSDFLESLDKRMQARALRMITLLAHNGTNCVHRIQNI